MVPPLPFVGRPSPSPSATAPEPPSPAGSVPSPRPDFKKIFESEARFVWRSLTGLGLLDADAADASQQVFLVLHQKLSDWNGVCPLRTFLYGICLRVASDVRKRAHRRYERLEPTPPEIRSEARQEREVARRQALDRLEGVLADLPTPQRSAFVLFEIEGYSMAEVAVLLGCPLPTAYARHQAARSAVMAAFADDREGP